MRDYTLYLKDIIESIVLIEQFVAGMESEDLKKDIKTSDAVIKRFENIGEAAKNIPKDKYLPISNYIKREERKGRLRPPSEPPARGPVPLTP